ncbi:sensor histidine kinase [Casimicrobium huifangae]|uniref:sensor histidine kinase n=1 Tax=Casimicrobium huifangae TaxID=2591109 RepID=UPI003784D57F
MDPKIEARLKPGTDYHPLQVIPFFRRCRPSVLRNLLFTAILCAIVIAVIVLFSLGMGHRITWKMLAEVATFSLLIGYTQHYLYKITITLARRRQRLAPLLMHPMMLGVALPIAAIYVGYVLAVSLLTGTLWLNVSENWRGFVFASCVTIAIGWLLWEAIEATRKKEVERRERAELQANVDRAERERTTAELKALRAQVEPHFLYNTLSNVVSLIEREPATAKYMTERLIGYLRHTLDASRREHATVGDELAIIADYLEILRLRMGERLWYEIAADDATRALPLSPMLLQPLVENAIKHGLEPKIEGGRITVSAVVQDDRLNIVVEDTGLGFGVATDTAGSGSGLANVRGRLKAIYGDAARLSIEQPEAGTRIRLSLPIAASAAE